MKDYQHLSDLMSQSAKKTQIFADCLSQFALIPNQKLRLLNLHPLAHRCRYLSNWKKKIILVIVYKK